MPFARCGYIFGSTMDYPMALFAGDLAAANAWSGDSDVTLSTKYKKAVSAQKLADLDALVFDVGGKAHVSFAFRDGDTIVFVEDAGDEPDISPKVIKQCMDIGTSRQKFEKIGTIEVPSGILVVAEAWKDFGGDALEGGKKPSGAKARKSEADESLLFRVTAGNYAISRRPITEISAGIVKIVKSR